MSKNYISGILFKKELDSNNNIIGRTPILPRTLTSEIITSEPNESGSYVKLSKILSNITTKNVGINNVEISTIKTDTLYTDSITCKTNSNTSISFKKTIIPETSSISYESVEVVFNDPFYVDHSGTSTQDDFNVINILTNAYFSKPNFGSDMTSCTFELSGDYIGKIKWYGEPQDSTTGRQLYNVTKLVITEMNSDENEGKSYLLGSSITLYGENNVKLIDSDNVNKLLLIKYPETTDLFISLGSRDNKWGDLFVRNLNLNDNIATPLQYINVAKSKLLTDYDIFSGETPRVSGDLLINESTLVKYVNSAIHGDIDTVTKNIYPEIHNTYDIGQDLNRFKNVYVNYLNAPDIYASSSISSKLYKIAFSDKVTKYFTLHNPDSSSDGYKYLDLNYHDNSDYKLLSVKSPDNSNNIIKDSLIESYVPILINGKRVTVNPKTCYIGYGNSTYARNEYHYTLDYNTTIYDKIMQFQNAIKNAIESGYDEIIILPGVYYLGSPVIVTRGNTTIKGLGYNTVIRTPLHTPAFILDNTGITIKDMSIITVISKIVYDELYESYYSTGSDTNIHNINNWWKDSTNPQPTIFAISDVNYGSDSAKPELTSRIIINSSSCIIKNINFANHLSEHVVDMYDSNYTTGNQFMTYYKKSITFSSIESGIISNINSLLRFGFKIDNGSVSNNSYIFVPKQSIGNNNNDYESIDYSYRFIDDSGNIYNINSIKLLYKSNTMKIVINPNGDGGDKFIDINSNPTLNFEKAYDNKENIITWSSVWNEVNINIAESYGEGNNFETKFKNKFSNTHITIDDVNPSSSIHKVKFRNTDISDTNYNLTLRFIDNTNTNKKIENSILFDEIYFKDISQFGGNNVALSLYYKGELVYDDTVTGFLIWVPERPDYVDDAGVYHKITVGNISYDLIYNINREFDDINTLTFNAVNRSNANLSNDKCFYDSIIHSETSTDTDYTYMTGDSTGSTLTLDYADVDKTNTNLSDNVLNISDLNVTEGSEFALTINNNVSDNGSHINIEDILYLKINSKDIIEIYLDYPISHSSNRLIKNKTYIMEYHNGYCIVNDIVDYPNDNNPKKVGTKLEYTYNQGNIFYRDSNNYDNYCKYLGFSTIYINNYWNFLNKNIGYRYNNNCNKIMECLFQNSYDMFKVYTNSFYSDTPKRSGNTETGFKGIYITLSNYIDGTIYYYYAAKGKYNYPKTLLSDSTANSTKFRIVDTWYNAILADNTIKNGILPYVTLNDKYDNGSEAVYANNGMNPELIKLMDGSMYHS